MKLDVVDITYSYREVEIPDKCPTCGEPSSRLTITDVEIITADYDVKALEGRVELTAYDSRDGSDGLGTHGYYCPVCGHTYAEGDVKKAERPT